MHLGAQDLMVLLKVAGSLDRWQQALAPHCGRLVITEIDSDLQELTQCRGSDLGRCN